MQRSEFSHSHRTANEDIVQSSARFVLEHRQMEQRLRMDVPTLNDPHVRDLFQESELFVRSFSGVANFGLFSPLDFLRILTLVSEAVSHVLVLWSLTSNRTHLSLLAFSIISYILPLLISWRQNTEYADDCQDVKTARATAKQNKMHGLARSDAHRPEVILFGLGPWILDTWAAARRTTLGLDQRPSLLDRNPLADLMSNINTTGLLVALHNVSTAVRRLCTPPAEPHPSSSAPPPQIPVVLAMQSSSTTLGSFTLYRSSVESIVFAVRQLLQLLRMAFQGVFLMGAFCAAMQVQPKLQPSKKAVVAYPPNTNGMRIEARCAAMPFYRMTTVKVFSLIGTYRSRTPAAVTPPSEMSASH